MEKDVLVRITGLQLQDEEGRRENVEVMVPGTWFIRNGVHFLRYEEMLDESGTPTVNYVKLSPGSMEVRKKGLVNVHMVFERGKKNMTCYTTPFGTLEMGIAATGLSFTENEDGLEARVEYSLDINNEFVAECCLELHVQETTEG